MFLGLRAATYLRFRLRYLARTIINFDFGAVTCYPGICHEEVRKSRESRDKWSSERDPVSVHHFQFTVHIVARRAVAK
jgi:hypothetical protein